MLRREGIVAALARQKWVLLGSACVVILGIGTFAWLLSPPQYKSSARVLLEVSRHTPPSLQTEVEIFRSPDMARQVMTVLKLYNDPEFLPAGKKSKSAESKFLSLSVKSPVVVDPIALGKFLRQLEVETVNGSYILIISFTSPNPERAAAVANTYAQLYISHHSSSSEPDQADREIAGRLGAVQKALTESESELGKLQKANSGEAFAKVLSKLIEEQKTLSSRYGPKHPRMLELAARIEESRIAATASLTPDVAARLRQLEISVENNRRALGGVMTLMRMKEAQTHARKQEAAKILAPAVVPSVPIRKIPTWLFMVAPLSGLLVGLFIAAVREKRNRGFNSPDHVEKLLGKKPQPVSWDAAQMTPDYVMRNPASPAAEALRSLRATLKLLGERQGRQLKIVTVTGPTENDVSSLTALWLARLAARSGENVLIVDANLRQPNLHTLLGRANTPSLSDYLAGQGFLEQMVWKQDPSGVHVIFSSAVPNTALDLIGSEKMKKLCGYFRQSYDLVLICAPPVLASADAVLLANESDHALYVIPARCAPREQVLEGLDAFREVGLESVSLIFANIKGR